MDAMFWVWLGVIVLSAIIELVTMEVVSIWFTIGAVLPFILAATRAVSWVWQLVIFVVISAICIVALRGITKKFLLKNSNEKTNLDALVGQKFRMISRTDFETIGSVKINDVVWSAVGEERQTIEEGEIVEIVKISGNKMIVKKAEEKNPVSPKPPKSLSNKKQEPAQENVVQKNEKKAGEENNSEKSSKENAKNSKKKKETQKK